ncbi:FkbM family methyltransferase [Candidatus Pelagibacter sp. Uisw_127]|uniref:FkbM family methyltransferase n=1 Tax=Candidatus Pelagibacter sp. Uisw_127 TaxID=3230988 RepID=UPI0039E793E0
MDHLIKFIKKLKYIIVRLIEKNPHLNLFIYNRILYFTFLLPHEKDYYGMKLLLKSNKKNIFLDIGGNNGLSTRGFKKLGFKNSVYIYEPNKYLYNTYLNPLSKKFLNVKIFNFGLGNKNSVLELVTPYVGNSSLHFMSSFSKKYILDSVGVISEKYKKKMILRKSLIIIKKLDDLKINKKIDFIKMDIEGYEHEALKGMKKTILKNKPIFLIEYNDQNIKKIYKCLNGYKAYIFDVYNNNFKEITLKNLKKHKILIGKQNKKNFLSSRNFYFVPKKKEFLTKCNNLIL